MCTSAVQCSYFADFPTISCCERQRDFMSAVHSSATKLAAIFTAHGEPDCQHLPPYVKRYSNKFVNSNGQWLLISSALLITYYSVRSCHFTKYSLTHLITFLVRGSVCCEAATDQKEINTQTGL